MEKNVTVTTDHKSTPRISKALPKTKHGSRKTNENRTASKRNCSKFMALQEALQDPITVCEGT